MLKPTGKMLGLVITLLFAATFIVACGKKGDLYLPDSEQQQSQKKS